MTRRSPVLAVLTIALVGWSLVGCSGSDSDGASPTTAPTTAPGGDGGGDPTVVDDPTGTFAPHDCWWDTADLDPAVTVTCSTLTVPADWNHPGKATVVLPVARLHHRDTPADTPPLVVLHGGPGGNSLAAAPVGASKGPLVKVQDIIAYDQRGAGRATPSLNCPEKEAAVIAALAEGRPLQEEVAANLAATKACRARLVGDGIDLNDYNTIQSVNDLEALRHAVEADTWNVQGGSYGTRLGLAYARAHPDRIRALVLDSVYPPQIGDARHAIDAPTAALDRLIDACADQPACAKAYPDLGAIIDRAARSLDENPGVATAEVTVDAKQVDQQFHLVGSDFRSGMYAALYQKDLIPLLPSVIDGLAKGDRSILGVYIETAVPLITGLSEGAYFSVDCADSGRLLDGADAADIVGDGTYELYALNLAQTWCSVWDVRPLPASFNEVARPDVATIVFAGTLDPVTPYTESKDQAEAMPNARLVTVPGGGHGDAAFDDCTQRALLGFLQDPTSDLPACTAHIALRPFTVPAGG